MLKKVSWNKGGVAEAMKMGDMSAIAKLGAASSSATAAGEESLESLLGSMFAVDAKVTGVNDISGFAKRAFGRTKKVRHMFELGFKLDFSITVDESMGVSKDEKEKKDKTHCYKGTLVFTDVGNTNIRSEPGVTDIRTKLAKLEESGDIEVRFLSFGHQSAKGRAAVASASSLANFALHPPPKTQYQLPTGCRVVQIAKGKEPVAHQGRDAPLVRDRRHRWAESGDLRGYRSRSFQQARTEVEAEETEKEKLYYFQ